MLSEEEIPQDGMGTMTMSEERRMAIAKEMASLQGEVDDLRKLVNTLLTIISNNAVIPVQINKAVFLICLHSGSFSSSQPVFVAWYASLLK